jgi:hypothetical protein
MIAILEGGYNANTGIISSFAQSVFTFIRYMNIGINVLQCYDVKLTSNKRKMQYNEEMELYNMFYKTKIKQRRSERIKQMEEKEKKEELKNDNQNSNSIVSKDNNVDNNIMLTNYFLNN